MKRLFLAGCAFASFGLAGCATTPQTDYVALAKTACTTATTQITALQNVDDLLPVPDSLALDKIASAVKPVCTAVASISTDNAQGIYTALLEQLPAIAVLIAKYAPVIAGAV
jgi:hypothetical protein